MKSIISNDTTPRITNYPYLGYWADRMTQMVVLFTSEDSGTLVYCSDDSHSLGRSEQRFWAEADYVPFKGTITLSN